MSFHPLRRGLQVFSSIHFIQIDIGYEFFVHWEEGYMFFALHPNVHGLWIFIHWEEGYMFFSSIDFIQIEMGYEFFCPLRRGLDLFSSMHFIQIDIGYQINNLDLNLSNILNLLTLVGTQ
jgi:hypothetical protein